MLGPWVPAFAGTSGRRAYALALRPQFLRDGFHVGGGDAEAAQKDEVVLDVLDPGQPRVAGVGDLLELVIDQARFGHAAGEKERSGTVGLDRALGGVVAQSLVSKRHDVH